MKSSCFVTNTLIRNDTGGGVVCQNIIQALKESTCLNWIIDAKTCSPILYEQPESPFLYDYFASLFSPDAQTAVIYGSPFPLTTLNIRQRHSAQIIADVAPHNIELSREEHQKLGYNFPYPHLNNPTLFQLYMRHVATADTVIVHSKVSGEYLKQKLGISDYTVIPHGCNPPKEIPPMPETFTVGHLGVNGPDKGQIYYVQALKQVDVQARLAGPGTESLGGAGVIPDTAEFYKRISVYVQPSVTEGFGIPVLEAMSYGRPVIVTEGAGANELITEGVDGFVVPIRSPDAIAEKIKFFQKNPDKVAEMGLNARATALKNTWAIIREKYKVFWQ